MDYIENRIIDKNILSSTHICFLFGAGVNGSALPQLSAFSETDVKLKEYGLDTSNGIEAAIDEIEDDEERNLVRETFIREFKKYHLDALEKEKISESESIKNIERLLRKVYLIARESKDRNSSMKQINIYTLNYDTIIEKVLANLGYLYNSISASNNSMKVGLIDVIGYNYSIKKYIPTFMISKLHGDIEKPIIPGKAKYKDILNEDYFEVVFKMIMMIKRTQRLFVIKIWRGHGQRGRKSY